MKSGIYLITNTKNWKRYVGKDSNIPYRWTDHKAKLRIETHSNSHLQSSWNNYGESVFSYVILRYCKREELVEWEQFYMDLYDTLNPSRGYNKKDAEGHIVSKETRVKLSVAGKGRIPW